MNELPDVQTASSPAPPRHSIWQRIRTFGFKRLFLVCVGVGVGMVVGLAGIAYSIVWLTSRPIAAREWPRLEVEGAGLRANLKTDWNDSARYQLKVTPRSDDLKVAFDKTVRSHRDSISFTIHLYDRAGFELCKKDVKPTPFVDASDSFTGLEANDTFLSFECSRSSYKQADRWTLSYVFPALTAETNSGQALNQDNAATKGWSRTKPSTQQDTPVLEGDDTLTGFDLGSGHLETRSGKTFFVYRDGERLTALLWNTSAPIHFNCKPRSDCLIENATNNEAVHGRLLR